MKWTLFLVFAAAALAQDETGSVQGTVTDSVTHLPVRKARVVLYPQNISFRRPTAPATGAVGRAAVMPEAPQFPSATTDGSGTFTISGLAPGTYSVNVEQSLYPARNSGRPQMTIVQVAAGTEPARISIELTPGAAITGRIVDEDGDPIENCYVHAVAPPSRSPNQYVSVIGFEPSNDKGVYRVYGVAPVKAVVWASCGRPVFQPRPLSPLTTPPPPPTLAYPPQFYPGVTDASSAQVIELAPGATREGVDFRMKPIRVYSVKGTIRVLPGATVPDRGNNFVALQKRTTANDMASRMGGSGGGVIDWSKGTFEIQAVVPGSYTLVAQGLPIQADVDVADRPVEIVVDLHPPIELKGAIVVEGESRTPMARFNVQLIPVDQFAGGPGVGSIQPREDGAFTVAGLAPRRYTVQVFPSEVFVKSAIVNGQEAPGGVIDLRNGGSEVRLLLSTRTGTLTGTAPAGRMVQVMSAGQSSMMYGSRGTSADQQGKFTIGQLAPGKYRVSLDGDWDNAEEISVAEGETVNVDLKAPVGQP